MIAELIVVDAPVLVLLMLVLCKARGSSLFSSIALEVSLMYYINSKYCASSALVTFALGPGVPLFIIWCVFRVCGMLYDMTALHATCLPARFEVQGVEHVKLMPSTRGVNRQITHSPTTNILACVRKHRITSCEKQTVVYFSRDRTP